MSFMEIDKLFLFIIFFVPGFISMKIYDLLVPGEYRDFSKSLSEAIGYSCLNFAALSWLIILIHKNNFYNNHNTVYLVILFLIIFVIPILWPILMKFLMNQKFITKYINNPIPKPWDYVFLKREPYWIIVHLKDGTKIGGVYDHNSYASIYPIEEQIYLEEVWKLDTDGKFLEPIERSKGIIIMRDEISAIEFFK